MKPDVLICWPDNCDYPLFRQFIRDNRELFNKIIIVFTAVNRPPNISSFIVKVMREDDVLFLINPFDPVEQPTGDWRNVAMNEALKFSTSQWVWFIEQDFIIKNIAEFMGTIQALMLSYNVIGIHEGKRLHPCCLLINRKFLQQLDNDFSAKSPEYDHFGAIQKQLEELNIQPAIIPENMYIHMAGVSHNWNLVLAKEQVLYRPEQFKLWLAECLKVKVPLNYLWAQAAKKYLGLIY